MVYDVLDLLGCGLGLVGDFARAVCGAGQSASLPGQKEHNTTIIRLVDQKTLGFGAKLLVKHNVRALGRNQAGLGVRAVHLADNISKVAGGVNNSLGLDRDDVAGEEVLHLGAAQTTVLSVEQTNNVGVVGKNTALGSGGGGAGHVVASIIELTVVVNNSTNKTLSLQLGEALGSLSGGDEVAATDVGVTRHDVVELEKGKHLRNLGPGVQRGEDGDGVGQVGGLLEHATTLVQGLVNQVDLGHVALGHSLLKVAHTTVKQFGACARRAGSKVNLLNYSHRETTAKGIQSGTTTRGTTTKNKHVELGGGELGKHLLTRNGGLGSGTAFA
eukprot:comp21267_c0_seq1/m.29002 comp21267_c0_seq1/g.29002  ORF comp21267_c0_seq1/g.29002 comp21267_c0_seq1/m.29002 type:complete len:329 (+) comp21267_c0_seq1:1044-2030(+)